MHTERYEKKDVNKIIKLLKEGKVVAFPTDTVYGLAVIYGNEEALEALKRSKGRPDNKPIPLMVSSLKQMEEIAYMNDASRKLANTFMPGAFTMILKKQEKLPAYITNGLATVGIRMPNDSFVLQLIEGCEKPLLVTSANLSGFETGILDQQVLSQLEGRIDAIVMGEASGKLSSTIVDMSDDKITIIRVGPVSKTMIEQALIA